MKQHKRWSGLLGISVLVLAACNGGGGGSTGSGPGQVAVTPSLALLAGAPLSGQGSADGVGTAAGFFAPTGVAEDAGGNLYVADSGNNTIRKISATGDVSTLAGAAGVAGSADATGTAARFNSPGGVAVDGGGTVYVADTGNNTIREISPAGVVTTLAGTAGAGGAADGTGAAAQFNAPTHVALDGAGNVYVADAGNDTIRRISPQGVVTTLAGRAGVAGDGDGVGAAARFNVPTDLAFDSSGNLYVADLNNNTIRRISVAGVVSTLAGRAGTAGSADGTGAVARFNNPSALAVDAGDNIYVADTGNGTIRQLSRAGVVTTLAGTAGLAGHVDGAGAAATFDAPSGLAVNGTGVIYVADSGNNTIREISPAGVVSTLAGTIPNSSNIDGLGANARFNLPTGIAVDALGNTYVADRGDDTIRKIDILGQVSTLAGSPGVRGSADGAGADATFSSPSALAVGADNTIYVADTGNDTIRRISAIGVVTTLAGSAGTAGSDDGGRLSATFRAPAGITVDAAGNVYVADSGNQTIRRISPQGVVSTLAGNPGVAGSRDGSGSAATFGNPTALAVDHSGIIYVADTGNNTVRRISPTGVVSTLAGSAGSADSADGEGSQARFNAPAGLAVSASGTVYVADTGNDTIRRISLTGAVSTVVGSAGVAGYQLGALPGLVTAPKAVALRPGSSSLVFLANSGAVLTASGL